MPFGGGGLSCGTAIAIRAALPDVRIIVAESDAATPLTSALQAGGPVTVEMKSSFISGAGASSVLNEMWPLVSELVADTVVVPVANVANAIRLLFERDKVIAEGAGAISVAAALASDERFGKTVCVVSGGNIDAQVMVSILRRVRGARHAGNGCNSHRNNIGSPHAGPAESTRFDRAREAG